jgi:hypothetical protein
MHAFTYESKWHAKKLILNKYLWREKIQLKKKESLTFKRITFTHVNTECIGGCTNVRISPFLCACLYVLANTGNYYNSAMCRVTQIYTVAINCNTNYSRVSVFAGVMCQHFPKYTKFCKNLYSHANSPRRFLCMPKHLHNHLQLTEKCLNVL